ncbi:hypothetical protein [Paracoccus benzoatiresistens]|uniref:Uncharacterized protein n=1 Tax=Paracoccus benzoatiresistens TaxID=2997341 RepID=A0ABT4J1V7_9RHOB|nr:hypothetical protein [Paracoccus sp. EF6]MCZ0961080.1 hypothetical protein [Paracoccus sp. EF6]
MLWISLSRRIGLVAAISGIIGLVPFGPRAQAQESSFRDFPYVIFCEYEQITSAYYFSRLQPDGRAIYMTPDRQVGVITLDGVAQRVDGERPGSCQGKTLDELRAAGRAFDLPA